jgi:hypothetical protein
MNVLNTIKWGMGLSVLGACASIGLSACSSVHEEQPISPEKPKPVVSTSHVGEGDGIKLSEALNTNLKTDALTPERTQILKLIVQNSKHKKHGKGLVESAAAFDSCVVKFKNADECIFLKPSWSDSWLENDEEVETSFTNPSRKADEEVVQAKLSKRKHAKVIQQIVKNLKANKLDAVTDQREGDYYRAFKKIDAWTPELQTLADRLIAQKECVSPEVYNYLALKTEEYFPNPELLKTTMALYSKLDQCATDDPAIMAVKYVQNSRFRLGLLSVMQNDCGSATKVFSRLAKTGVNDFTTRALYWNAFCAKSDPKKAEFLSNVDELFRANPLGFHTLSINHGESLLLGNLTKPIDPIIQRRTTNHPQYNRWISVVEDLDKMGEYDTVRRLLAPLKKNPDYLTGLEPGVRLYLSTFAYRSKDTMSLFRILDSVFRTQSEYVVDSTLKLFYPLKYLDVIAADVKRVNPFLITALIRQESAFQDMAHSGVGAVGLMQLMPYTAKLIDRKIRRKTLYLPENNLRIGIQYFENLVDRYQGDVELALAAYNAGPEVVDKWALRYPMTNKLLFLDLIPYTETRNYVTLIGRNYYWYSKIYADQMKSAPGIAQMTPVEFQALK